MQLPRVVLDDVKYDAFLVLKTVIITLFCCIVSHFCF